MLIEDCNELMLPGHDRDTSEQLDGQVRVHIVDRLEGITPEMYEWWFGNMDHDTYMQWHPRDHKEFAWVSGWEPGRYVGATHMTTQTLGGAGAPMRANITFAPRALWFDWRMFAQHDVGVVICAIVHMRDEAGQPLADEAVRFVHLGIRRDYGTELRSSFWLNVSANADLERATVGRTKHVHEECRYLCGFLPQLYASRVA
jgi:DAPG hydrolase PhiG domain